MEHSRKKVVAHGDCNPLDEDFTYGLTSFLIFIKMGYALEPAVFDLFWFGLVHVYSTWTLVANICISFSQSDGTSAGQAPSDGLLTSDWQTININTGFPEFSKLSSILFFSS